MAQLPYIIASGLAYILVTLQIQNQNIDETAVSQEWKGIKKHLLTVQCPWLRRPRLWITYQLTYFVVLHTIIYFGSNL